MDEKKKAVQKTTAEKKSKTTGEKKTSEKKTAKKNASEKLNEKENGEKKIKVTLVRSVIGTKESHRATVRGLGLKRLNHSVELSDTPAIRGMINKVSYLLKAEG